MRIAYRAQISAAHPDRAGGRTDLAAAVNAAYATLQQAERDGHLHDHAHDHAPTPTPAPRPRPAPTVTEHEPGFEEPPEVLDGDTVHLAVPPDEAFVLLLDACHQIGDVTYIDRSCAILEALVRVEGEGVCSLVITLQGRATGTDAFCTLEAIEHVAAPRSAPSSSSSSPRSAQAEGSPTGTIVSLRRHSSGTAEDPVHRSGPLADVALLAGAAAGDPYRQDWAGTGRASINLRHQMPWQGTFCRRLASGLLRPRTCDTRCPGRAPHVAGSTGGADADRPARSSSRVLELRPKEWRSLPGEGQVIQGSFSPPETLSVQRWSDTTVSDEPRASPPSAVVAPTLDRRPPPESGCRPE